MTSPELRSGQGTYCREPRATGSYAPQLGPPSPLPPHGWASSRLPQLRSSSALRRLTRSHRSGSDTPLPLAILDLSPLFFYVAYASFSSLPFAIDIACASFLLSATSVVSHCLSLRVLLLYRSEYCFPLIQLFVILPVSLTVTACASFLLLPRVECWPRGG